MWPRKRGSGSCPIPTPWAAQLYVAVTKLACQAAHCASGGTAGCPVFAHVCGAGKQKIPPFPNRDVKLGELSLSAHGVASSSEVLRIPTLGGLGTGKTRKVCDGTLPGTWDCSRSRISGFSCVGNEEPIDEGM